jgi:hypothetical protein
MRTADPVAPEVPARLIALEDARSDGVVLAAQHELKKQLAVARG